MRLRWGGTQQEEGGVGRFSQGSGFKEELLPAAGSPSSSRVCVCVCVPPDASEEAEGRGSGKEGNRDKIGFSFSHFLCCTSSFFWALLSLPQFQSKVEDSPVLSEASAWTLLAQCTGATSTAEQTWPECPSLMGGARGQRVGLSPAGFHRFLFSVFPAILWWILVLQPPPHTSLPAAPGRMLPWGGRGQGWLGAGVRGGG